MSQFKYEKDAKGIVTVTMDMDGPVNAMNEAFFPLFRDMVERLEAAEGLTGVVLASAKNTFFAGGDLKRLIKIEKSDIPAFFDEIQGMKAAMRRFEKLPVPKAAAINGAALGGGFEICLLCNRRIATTNRATKIGLPEVGLGLLPGGGGVVRLTNLIGIQAAVPLLTQGTQLSPDKALAAGMIHEVLDQSMDLIAHAKVWIESVQGDQAASVQPWDIKGFRIPGGPATSPKNAQFLVGATAMTFKKTKGLMPAPQVILDVVSEAAGRLDFDTALRFESRRFVGLLVTPEAKNMISTFFFDMNKVNGGAGRPGDVPPTKVKRLGILGAGMMGQGIAYCSAMAEIEVVLKDMTQDAADAGKAYTKGLLDKRVAQGRMTQEKRDQVLARITPTAETDDLRGCELVIEAVFERIDIKNQVLTDTEEVLAENGVWASNTSTLPITRLAKKSKKPANFVGLHFFSPVDKMPLLEIIAGEHTSDETLARAFDYARQIKKTPIIVNDSTGFYTSRTIGTKIFEAIRMVGEGHDPLRVDNLSALTGMPTGMLSLADEVKTKLMADIFNTQVDMGLLDPDKDADKEVRDFVSEFVGQHGREGKFCGKGFYDYSKDGKRIWEGLLNWRDESAVISDQDIKDRIMFRPILESLKCLEEGVLRNVADGNIGSIMGIGAPIQTGGYIQFVNTYGIDRFIARCEELAETYGERFNPPQILRDKAAKQETFA